MELRYDKGGLPTLDQLSEDGFVDLTFRVCDLHDDGHRYHFQLMASFREVPVGLKVDVVKGIQAGFDGQVNLVRDHVYREGVRFSRSGSESDRLISAIAVLYEQGDGSRRMVDQETFTAIALHQGPLDIEREAVKLKIFGRDGEPLDEDAYYESLFNVDLSNGLVFWNEKDDGYREPLLRALSQGRT